MLTVAFPALIQPEETGEADALWELITALPDNPTADEEALFYKKLSEISVLCPLKDDAPKAFFAKVAAMLGFTCGERIVHDYIFVERSKDDLDNFKFYSRPTWKPRLIELALIRTLLEKCTKLPEQEAGQYMVYARSGLDYVGCHATAGYGIPFDAAINAMYERRRAESIALEDEFKAFAKQDQKIEQEVVRLMESYKEFPGLNVWLRLIEEAGKDNMRLSTLLLWYFRCADPSAALLPDIEDYRVYKNDTIFSIPTRYIRPEYRFSPEFSDNTMLKRDAPATTAALALPQAMALNALFSRDNRWPLKKDIILKMLLRFTALGTSGIKLDLHTELIEFANRFETSGYISDAAYRERISRHLCALKEVERGTFEDAWFIGATELNGKGVIELKSDFIYPVLESESDDVSAQQFYSHLARKDYYPCILGNTDYYYWRSHLYFRCDEEGDRTKIFTFNPISLEYDFSDEGIQQALARGDFEKWTLGLRGFQWNVFTVDYVKKAFTPTVLYHFNKAQWRILQIQNINPDTGLLFYDRPTMVMIVEPIEGTNPDKVMAGYVYKVNWLFRNGVPFIDGQHWSAKVIRDSQQYKDVFNRAMKHLAKSREGHTEQLKTQRKLIDMELERLYGVNEPVPE